MIFHRRSRAPEERPLFLGHAARIHAGARGRPRVCAAREVFLGRRGSTADPRGTRDARIWGLHPTTALDAVAATRCPLRLAPHGEAEVVFLWTASRSYETVRHALELYSAADHAELGLRPGARTQRARAPGPGPPAGAAARGPASPLARCFTPTARCRARPASIGAQIRPQSALWSTGVSGDHPILLVRVAAETRLRSGGARPEGARVVDRTRLSRGPGSDRRGAQRIRAAGARPADARAARGRPGGPPEPAGRRVRPAAEWLRADERGALERAAAVVLDTEAGDLGRQIALAAEEPELPRFVATRTPAARVRSARRRSRRRSSSTTESAASPPMDGST